MTESTKHETQVKSKSRKIVLLWRRFELETEWLTVHRRLIVPLVRRSRKNSSLFLSLCLSLSSSFSLGFSGSVSLFFSLYLSLFSLATPLSLSFAHTHAYTNTYTHANMQTAKHTQKQTDTHKKHTETDTQRQRHIRTRYRRFSSLPVDADRPSPARNHRQPVIQCVHLHFNLLNAANKLLTYLVAYFHPDLSIFFQDRKVLFHQDPVWQNQLYHVLKSFKKNCPSVISTSLME